MEHRNQMNGWREHMRIPDEDEVSTAVFECLALWHRQVPDQWPFAGARTRVKGYRKQRGGSDKRRSHCARARVALSNKIRMDGSEKIIWQGHDFYIGDWDIVISETRPP